MSHTCKERSGHGYLIDDNYLFFFLEQAIIFIGMKFFGWSQSKVTFMPNVDNRIVYHCANR